MMIKGGFTSYGQDIGILMMPTVFPRIPGDIGNAKTFPFPVRYRIVEDVEVANLSKSNAQERLIQPFIRAAQALEAEGCKAITTSCSFLSGFQRELADAVHIPVFTSALLLVPMIRAMLGRDQKIGIFTMNPALMTEEIFLQSGWSAKDVPVCVSGMSPDSDFARLIIGDLPEGNPASLETCMRDLARQHMSAHPETGAILLECPNYAPFAKLVQEVSGVPVFSINQLVEFMHACVSIRNF